MSSIIIFDTSIVLGYLRGGISKDLWERTIQGRIPTITPVTLHEIRRGIKPGSRWEEEMDNLVPRETIVTAPPTHEDWILAADTIRKCFWKTKNKEGLSTLSNDALIVAIARREQAVVWARDQDFKVLCEELRVTLFFH